MQKSGELGTEANQLIWLRWRDELVRAEMAVGINKGTTAGEALVGAWSKLRYKWDMSDAQPATATLGALCSVIDENNSYPTGSEAMPQRPKKQRTQDNRRQTGDSSWSAAWPQKDGQQRWKSMSFHPGTKKKLCGAFGTKKGCREPCPQQQLHVCSVKTGENSICGSTTHSSIQHQERKR